MPALAWGIHVHRGAMGDASDIRVTEEGETVGLQHRAITTTCPATLAAKPQPVPQSPEPQATPHPTAQPPSPAALSAAVTYLRPRKAA